ncbi:tRNA 2-selenouridine(34) synthase MnmH [Neobacillus sp. LXY-4]|uniref:tRNA 2-selenouridine(34) synthase MnmH n=1 Tax=Neobacillus sp. LXY-4 TaxID=3379826 RepID=UPI003EE2E1E1
MTLIDISIEEFFKKKNAVPVDVRSPEEFSEGTIPGAINIPLFNDVQRKEVGTIYKQVGQEQAKWRAMELVSPSLPSMLAKIKDLAADGSDPVLFCWRGGMRSKSVATFLEFSGYPVYRIEGGYKAYRQNILEKLPSMVPDKMVVLHGMTGVGKTEILAQLSEKGYPVLDLEGLAAHKGSIFGSINPSHFDGNNQKTFDGLLYSRLSELNNASYLIVEAESKRIGKVTQPPELLDKKYAGLHFYLYSSIPNRVERIYREYVEPFYREDWFHPQVKEKLSVIIKRVKNITVKEALETELENQHYRPFISLLLEHYYDPRYQHKLDEYGGEFIKIDADHQDEAVYEIAEKIEAEFSKQPS